MMHGLLGRLSGFIAARAGSINIIAAIFAPVVLMMAALGLDQGNLIVSKRALQDDADLAAIVGASNMASAEAAVLNHFQLNNIAFAVRDGSSMLTKDGSATFSEEVAFAKYGGYAELVKGRYTADPAIAPDKRFVAGATPTDALKVTIRQSPALFFPGVFGAAPRLRATGTANVGKIATVGVSSRLASLNNGVVNSVLGALLGTTLSLSAMDSKALVDTDLDLLAFANQAAIDLNLQAGTYEQLLASDITYVQILAALAKTEKTGTAGSVALSRFAQQASKSKAKLKLGQLLNLGPYTKRRIGSITGLELNATIMEILSAAANIANAGRQVSVDLDGLVPGLATTKLVLYIGEPEVTAPYYGVARPDGFVRTAQTRLKLVTEVNGLSILAGLKIKLPLYVDIAKAEAKITAISCTSGSSASNATVDVAVKPAVAEISLGTVDEDKFFSTSQNPSVSMAPIISTILLQVNGKSRVTIGNMQATTLKFSPSEIKAGTVKTVSTNNVLDSAVGTLLSNLNLEVQLLNIPLVSTQALTTAIGQTLSGVVKPLDDVLMGVLALVGVRVGEADVRIGSASCQRPVVVN